MTANSIGMTPLYSAADNSHIEVVKFLLEKGADVNYLGGPYGSTLNLLACKQFPSTNTK